MLRFLPLFCVVALASLAACPHSTSTTGGSSAGGPGSVPGGAVDPAGSADTGNPSTDAGCQTDADCGAGICEGEGCGPDTPGTCVATDRMCTRDSVLYCGCDGTEFRGSGSCPGKRYAHRGTCEGSGPDAGKADGEPCLVAAECAGGVCEGEGCGDDLPGQCASNERACTRDYATYCGCDGQEFHGSGSCPGQRYAHRGECNQAGNKDDDGSGAGTKR